MTDDITSILIKVIPSMDKEDAKYFSDAFLDFKNSDGVNKKMLEAKNLRISLALSELAIKNAKNSFRKSLSLILIGALIALVPTFIDVLKPSSEEIFKNRIDSERKAFENRMQSELQQMRSNTISLEDEIRTLKIEMKK
jgi:hypothetical protein